MILPVTPPRPGLVWGSLSIMHRAEPSRGLADLTDSYLKVQLLGALTKLEHLIISLCNKLLKSLGLLLCDLYISASLREHLHNGRRLCVRRQGSLNSARNTSVAE